MTLQEFHREFKISLDKVDSLQYAEFTKQERTYFLNEATLRFVKQRYGGNNQPYLKGFEEIQKRTDDLKVLVKDTEKLLTNEVTTLYNYKYKTVTQGFNSISDYMFLLRLDGKVTYTVKENCVNVTKDVIQSINLVQIDDLGKVLKDPFNKPTIHNLVATIYDNNVRCYFNNTFTVNSLFITYLKYPNIYTSASPTESKVNNGNNLLDSNIILELSNHTYKEIIQIATQIGLENIQSDRLATQSQILQTIE